MPGSKNQKSGYAVREAALRILREHNRSGRYIKDLMADICGDLSEKDKSLAREIASGTVRWRALLDYNIGLYTPQKIKDRVLGNIMRLTVYQVLMLDTVPDYAAVNTGVELIKNACGRSKAGFANAVLKKIISGGLKKKSGKSLGAVSINNSYPLWMVKRWEQDMGRSGMKAALSAGNDYGNTWLRVNTNRLELEEAEKRIRKSGAEYRFLNGTPFFMVTGNLSGMLKSDLFREGAVAVQDPSAWYIACMLQPEKGDLILDMCSAPGGKSALLNEISGGGADIICADLSMRRMRLISDIRNRLGHNKLAPMVMDGNVPSFKGKFGKLLIDAPCSNQGVIAGKPEVKWRITAGKIKSLVKIQKSLLSSGSRLVKPEGILVYTTCSPDRHETSDIIEDFLKRNKEWSLEPAGNYIPEDLVKENSMRIFPGEKDFGGFFAARLRRASV